MATKTAKRLAHYLNSSALHRPLAAFGVLSAVFGAGSAQALDAGALPQGGRVVAGGASIAQSGRTLTVNQSTDRTVIDWRSFDIGAGAQANFNQPGANSIAVNRVNASADPTQIEGGLHANGQVWILNPNGVLFGKTAHVDAAGVVASTANIDMARFMAGDNRLTLTGADHGVVANDGAITVAAGGLAAFVAPSVRNSGSITAKVGKVALAAGATFTLDLAGDHLVEIGLGSGKAVVDQSGRIVAEGGVVTLSARAAGQVVDSVINMSGVVTTASARQVGGQIVLDGDAVTVAGTLDASGASGGQIAVTGKTIDIGPGAALLADAGASGDGGTITASASDNGNYAGDYSARGGSAGGDGGRIETSGVSVSVDDAIKVDASAPDGVAGAWLVDPLNVTISAGSGGGLTGGDVTVGAIQAALAGGTSVDITTDQSGADAGDLTLASSINATSTGGAGLTLEGRHLSAIGGSTINIAGGALTLDVNTVNALADVSAQPTNWIQDALNMVGTVSGGSTVNIGAGAYAGGVTISKAGLTLSGAPGSVVHVAVGQTGIAINANSVTVEGFEIAGPVTGAYDQIDWTTAGTSTGIAVSGNISTGPSGFDIADNDIHDMRTGIIVQGQSASGSITANTVENTKGGILIQYNDGTPYTISDNQQGAVGNEWGIVLNLNSPGADTGEAPLIWQSALLALSGGNNGLTVMDRKYASANRTRVAVDAASTAGAADDGGLGNGLGNKRQPLATLQAGIDAVVAGGEVDVEAGAYAGGVTIGKAGLTLAGAPGAVITVDAAAVNGVSIDADNVTVEGFEFAGPATTSYLTYAWGSDITRGVVVANGVTDFTITGNDIHGLRTGILIDGRNTGSVTDNLIDNTKSGISVQYTDGTGYDKSLPNSDAVQIAITGNTQGSNGNEWGINYHLNGYWNGVAGDESHPDANPVSNGAYLANAPTADQQSALLATSAANGGMSVQDQAYKTSNRTSVTVSTTGSDSNQGDPLSSLASIQAGISAVVSGGEVFVDNGTYVIPSGGDNYLSIDKSLSLVGQSQAGTIIDARGATAYGLRVQGDNVTLSDFTLLGSMVSGGYGIKVEPMNLTDPNARIDNFAIDHVTIDGADKNALDLNGATIATIDNVTAENAANGDGIALIDSADVTVTNSTTSNNAWGGLRIEEKNASFNQQTDAITVAANNTFNETSPVYLEDDSATLGFGRLDIAGFGYIVQSPTNPADVYTWFQKTQQSAIDFAAATAPTTATVQGYSGSGLTGNNVFAVGIGSDQRALSIQAAQNAAQAGATINIASGVYSQDVVVSTRTNFNFGSVTVDGFTIQSGASGSGLSGTLAATSINLAGAVTLLGDLTLDTSAAGGAIATGAIDAATAGGEALSINAGSGAVSLGSLGATTRLGATQVAGAATLAGAAYDANSLSFGGNVVLTAATTTFNTTQSAASAGNITISGSLLGTTDGGQNLALIAGPGTGAAGANADISLQNVGAGALRLGSLTVSGDDFGAQTVDLAGDFTATLVGNQVFSSHTLNAGGAVNSTVGGDASGPINATGAVTFAVLGNLTGAIAGTDISLTAGALTGATVTASQNVTVTADSVAGSSFNAQQAVDLNATTVAASSITAPTVTAKAATFDADVTASNAATISGDDISGSFKGGSFTLAATNSVNATVAATNVSVQAAQGTVTGSWQNLSTGGGDNGGGGGGLVVSPTGPGGQTANPNQIVVENFALPAGTAVTPRGDIILPEGLVIGLLSPGGAGGAPKLIQVQDVQDLGSLLAGGYTAIVIDLSGHKKKSKSDTDRVMN